MSDPTTIEAFRAALLRSPCTDISEFFEDHCQLLDLLVAAHDALTADLRVERDALREERDQAKKQAAILDLAIPIEDELQDRIDTMLKYLAMQQGFTLAGIAQLLTGISQRLSSDWLRLGHVTRLERELAEARAEIARTTKAALVKQLVDRAHEDNLRLLARAGDTKDVTPGCDCEQSGNPDPAYHASDCVWRLAAETTEPR